MAQRLYFHDTNQWTTYNIKHFLPGSNASGGLTTWHRGYMKTWNIDTNSEVISVSICQFTKSHDIVKDNE